MNDDTDTDATKATETADAAGAAAEAPEPTETVDAGAQADNGTDSGAREDRQDREAARYRRRLRETEAERDALAGQLEALRRTSIDAQAAVERITPAALWASGVQMEDLLTDDGLIDTEKVTAACAAARESLGLGPRFRNIVAAEGANVSRSGASAIDGFVDIVMGRSAG